MITKNNIKVFIVVVLAVVTILVMNLASIYSIKPQLGPILKPIASSKVIQGGVIQEIQDIGTTTEYRGFNH